MLILLLTFGGLQLRHHNVPIMVDPSLTRRRFLAAGAAGVLPLACAAQAKQSNGPKTAQSTELTEQDLLSAEKLQGLEFTPEERQLMLARLQSRVARLKKERELNRMGNGTLPMELFDPRVPGYEQVERDAGFVRKPYDGEPLPDNERDLVFAPLAQQAHWIEQKQLSCSQLLSCYISRISAFGDALKCVVSMPFKQAQDQAGRLDEEINAGKYRGPLHGIPYGIKDLFDTAGVKTTWGAAPFKDRVPDHDADVVKKLAAAGAVLIAKTSMGALAMGDQWYRGMTRNPFAPKQGSSGSSAGSAASVVAGLVSFAIGTETYGSIVSPSMVCGATGLRPTFGRVSRNGAMSLSWSLDKVGPMTRRVEDAILVLNAIQGVSQHDPATLDVPLNYDATEDFQGMRIGFVPEWFSGKGVSKAERDAYRAAENLGMEMVPIDIPKKPYVSQLKTILEAEAAANFERFTLDNVDDQLTQQLAESWPNIFRSAWHISAVDLLQAMRFRRYVCEMMQEKMQGLDAILGPSFAGDMLAITNLSGHPSLTIRSGFVEKMPTGVTLWGNLFDEGRLARIGTALEEELAVWKERPARL